MDNSEIILENGHEKSGSINFLCSIDDRTFVSAGNGYDIVFWDIEGNIIRKIKGHRKWISSLAIINENTIASGCKDGTLKIFGFQDDNFKMFTEHSGYITNINVIKPGIIVYCDQEPFGAGQIIIRNLSERNEIRSINPKCIVYCICVINENIMVWGGSGRFLQLFNINETQWDKKYGKKLLGHKDIVSCISKIDTEKVISGSWDKTLRIWNINSGDTLHILTGHKMAITQVIEIKPLVFLSGCMIGDSYRLWKEEEDNFISEPIIELGNDGCDCLTKINNNILITSGNGSHKIKINKPEIIKI